MKAVFKVLKSVREYKKQSIWSPVFISLEVFMETLLPFIMARLIDNMTGNSLDEIWLYVIILVLMALMSLTFGIIAGELCSKASVGFAKNLRMDLFDKIQSFSFSNIDKFSTSSLVTRMTTDISNVQNSYMMIIRVAIRAPLMFICSSIMSFAVGGKLALVFVCIIPLLIFGLVLIVKTAMPLFDKVFKKYDNLNNSVQENINAIRVVKSYVREDYESKKFKKASDDVCNDFTKAEKIVSLNAPLMNFVMYCSSIIISVLGTIIIIKTFKGYDINGNEIWGSLSPGQLSSLMAYGIQILSSLMFLSMIFVMLSMSVASIKRISEVLSEESNIVNPENPVTEVEDGTIIFKNVSFKYSEKAEKNALENIDFIIPSGKTVGIIGSTGSSKTTLIQLIARLYDTTTGEVFVGGHNVKEYDVKTLRNQVSIVLQKNVLFSGTIIENLRWGDKDASIEEIKKVCVISQADEFIESLPNKYETMIERGGTNVSGGQKQRLCIARALLKKPKIIVFDDSTSAVDTKTDALIRNGLKNEIPNTTKIIIAQRINSIQDADIIIVMDNGRINQIGTHDELLKTNLIYQEVYSTQNQVGGIKNE